MKRNLSTVVTVASAALSLLFTGLRIAGDIDWSYWLCVSPALACFVVSLTVTIIVMYRLTRNDNEK